MSDLGRLLFGESIEALAHEKVADEIRSAVAAGESDKTISKRALYALVNPHGPVMSAARLLPGFTLPAFGAALGHLLENSRFIDAIVPDHVHPSVKQAKMIIKAVGPNALIGAFAGIRDAVQDIDRVHANINREVDKVRSDPGTPSDQRNKSLDSVAWTRLLKDQVFAMARNSDGSIRPCDINKPIGSGGVPVVNNPTWVAYKAMWDETHKATTRQIPGGKGQQSRSEKVDAEPFPFEIITLEDAVARIGANLRIDPSDMEMVKGLLAKPKDWWTSAGADVMQLFIILGASIGHGSALQADAYVDLIKDVVGKEGVPFLQRVAAEYNLQAINGRFTPEVLRSIVNSFRIALGSTLEFWNRVKLFAVDAWTDHGQISRKVRIWMKTLLAFVILANLMIIVLFLGSFFAVMFGALMPYDHPVANPLTGTLYLEPGWLAAALMTVGSAVIIVLLFTLRIAQAILHPLAVRMLNAQSEWLAEFGWRFTFMLVPVLIFDIGALFLESSVSARVLCIALALMGIAIGMGYKVLASGAPAEWAVTDAKVRAYQLLRNGVRFGWLIMLGILLADYALRHAWHVAALGGAQAASSPVWDFLMNKHVLAIVSRFLIAAVMITLAVVAMERWAGKSGFIRFMAALCILTVMFFPWLNDALAGSGSTTTPSSATPSVTSPVTPPTPAAKTKRASSARQSASGGQLLDLDCDALSPASARIHGCP